MGYGSKDGREIAESTVGHYRLEGDDFWYTRVIGPGPDIPLINIGPGPHPDPRIIGPGRIGPQRYGPNATIEGVSEDWEKLSDDIAEKGILRVLLEEIVLGLSDNINKEDRR